MWKPCHLTKWSIRVGAGGCKLISFVVLLPGRILCLEFQSLSLLSVSKLQKGLLF